MKILSTFVSEIEILQTMHILNLTREEAIKQIEYVVTHYDTIYHMRRGMVRRKSEITNDQTRIQSTNEQFPLITEKGGMDWA